MKPSEKPALLLIAHGSRSAKWNQAIIDLSGEVQSFQPSHNHPFQSIEHCFLEHAQPDIQTALRSLFERKMTHVIALPFFLSPGFHVSVDIPNQIEHFAQPCGKRMHDKLSQKDQMTIALRGHLSPAELLAGNVIRRFENHGGDIQTDGAVLVYYGSKRFPELWDELAANIEASIHIAHPGFELEHAMGGDAVGFAPDQIAEKIDLLSLRCGRVFVIPALIALGVIQADIIPRAIAQSKNGAAIVYRNDAALPDRAIAEILFRHALT